MIRENVTYVMNLGFFTSSNPNNAQLIAKTIQEFDKNKPLP